MVVNNAGLAQAGSVEDFALDAFRAQVETNFYGAVHVTRAALPVLRAQRSGLFLQISSIGGRRGKTAGLSAYQAAKFALEGFSESLAAEVAPLGIQVVIVEPGGIATEMGSSMPLGTIHPEYQATVGATAQRFHSGQAGSRGDPRKMARALAGLAGLTAPPRRLLLGTDALFMAKRSDEERLRELEAWRGLSASTDRDGLEDFADTGAAKALTRADPRP